MNSLPWFLVGCIICSRFWILDLDFGLTDSSDTDGLKIIHFSNPDPLYVCWKMSKHTVRRLYFILHTIPMCLSVQRFPGKKCLRIFKNPKIK
jgi:hypothetical protein